MGLRQAQKLKRRESMLLELKKLIRRFQTEIRYTARELGGLIAENTDLLLCAEAVKQQMFSSNPCEALEKAGDAIFENPPDKKLFSDFVLGLGASDTDGQLGHISLYSQLLEEHIADAAQDNKKRSRLFVGLGIFAGVTICVLII